MTKQAHKYTLVADHIRDDIEQGRITNKLPGERVLAKQLGVSYMTVRKAVESLVSERLVYKVPARGTYVAQRTGIRDMVFLINDFFESRLHKTQARFQHR